MSRSALLVLGMHRSGTSAVTGSLYRLGVKLGGHLLAPGEDNPKGYWEHEEAVRINNSLLSTLGRHWSDVRFLPDGWERSPAARAAVRDIGALLDSEFGAEELFAIKDPRMCLVLPVWLEALASRDIVPRALLVARAPVEVAASLKKRNDFTSAVSHALWLHYMLRAEYYSRDCVRTGITYGAFMRAPTALLDAAMRDLGLNEVAGEACRCDLSGFVSEEDRHHRLDGAGAADTQLARIAEDCYEAFERMVDGRSGADAGIIFDVLQERANQAMDVSSGLVDGIAAIGEDFRRQAENAAMALSSARSELNAQLAWSESAVQEREILQAELARARSELNAQLAWSESAVQEREILQAELARARSELNAQLAWAETAMSDMQQQALRIVEIECALSRHRETVLGRLNDKILGWRGLGSLGVLKKDEK